MTIKNVCLSVSSALNVFFLLTNPNSIKRYNICMGREENYKYNLENFYEIKHAGPVSSFPFTSPYRYVELYKILKKQISFQGANIHSLFLIYHHCSFLLHQDLLVQKESDCPWLWKDTTRVDKDEKIKEHCHILLQHNHLECGDSFNNICIQFCF